MEFHQAAVHRQICRHLREYAEVSAEGAEKRRSYTGTTQ